MQSVSLWRVSLLCMYQLLRIFREISLYKSREWKEGENVSLEKAFLWLKYLVTAKVNIICC